MSKYLISINVSEFIAHIGDLNAVSRKLGLSSCFVNNKIIAIFATLSCQLYASKLDIGLLTYDDPHVTMASTLSDLRIILAAKKLLAYNDNGVL